MLITIMSSLAQEESRSISENVTWGQRKRFSDGKVTVPFGHFLGYDRGEDGNLVLNEKEAVIVRRIFALFLEGASPHKIAKTLTTEGILSPGKKSKWNAATVRRMLENEKYKGDALYRKATQRISSPRKRRSMKARFHNTMLKQPRGNYRPCFIRYGSD